MLSIVWVLNEGLVLLLIIDKETFFFLKIKPNNNKHGSDWMPSKCLLACLLPCMLACLLACLIAYLFAYLLACPRTPLDSLDTPTHAHTHMTSHLLGLLSEQKKMCLWLSLSLVMLAELLILNDTDMEM